MLWCPAEHQGQIILGGNQSCYITDSSASPCWYSRNNRQRGQQRGQKLAPRERPGLTTTSLPQLKLPGNTSRETQKQGTACALHTGGTWSYWVFSEHWALCSWGKEANPIPLCPHSSAKAGETGQNKAGTPTDRQGLKRSSAILVLLGSKINSHCLNTLASISLL